MSGKIVRYSVEAIDKAKKLYFKSGSMAEVARQIGANPLTVGKWAKRENWKQELDDIRHHRQLKMVGGKRKANQILKAGSLIDCKTRCYEKTWSKLEDWLESTDESLLEKAMKIVASNEPKDIKQVEEKLPHGIGRLMQEIEKPYY